MTCSHCKANVENGVKSIAGITNAIANPDTDELLVEGEGFSSEDIQNKVEDLGYGYSGKLK